MTNEIHGAIAVPETGLRLSREVSPADGHWAGGKAAGLARLGALGATVPRWGVIGAEHFTAHISRAGSSDVLTRLSSTTDAAEQEQCAEQLQASILATPIDPALLRSVLEEFSDTAQLAVRSSAVDEDGDDRSFAGIYESFLYVVGANRLADAIRGCWASGFSRRAVHYRRGGNADTAISEVAVIVQEMVDGDVSGVLFTADPVTGSQMHALVSACWGLGEGVVGGICATDEFTLLHNGTEVSERLSDKDIEIVRGDDGGTREQAIPADRRTVRCLDTTRTARVVVEGVRIAAALGTPQDIEFTFRGDELVVLQARSITTRPVSPSPDEHSVGAWRTVWDNSNVQESFNGVTLPLTFSWAAQVYEVIFRETLNLIGVREKVVLAHEAVLRNMVGHVSGRVYYNINNWYRVLRLAPFFDRNKDDVEKMLGIENPVDFVEGFHATTRERVERIPELAPVFVVLAYRMAIRSRLVETFQREVGGEVDRIRRDLDNAHDLQELLALSERGLNLFGRWSIQILNDLYLSNQAGRARRLLAVNGQAASEEIVAGLLASEEAVESLQPTITLMRLATLVRADEELKQALQEGSPRDGYNALRTRSAAITTELDSYVQLFGDRCMGEQKLETVSLREDPSFIGTILRNYVADDSLDVDTFERAHHRRKVEFERNVLGAIAPSRRRKVARAVRRARIGVRDRERMRLTRTRIVGVGRSVYVRVGELMHRAGLLDEPRHIFFLTMDEITAYAEGRSTTSDLGGLARSRVSEYATYELTEPPNQFETAGPPYRLPHAPVPTAPAGANEAVLQGTGCWPGIVEGAIQVVMDPSDDLDVRGKIMTTMRTDPGWGPLFPSVKGLLIERGSTLSHSAVLARELGIPAVVGVPGLMATIRDGEKVRLDGATGKVERLDELD